MSYQDDLVIPKRVIVIFLLCLHVSQAGSAPDLATEPDPGRMGMSCLWRSSLCPGWGQLHAGSRIKALLFFGLVAALGYGQANAGSLSSTSQRELNRWTILFWLYNIGDAYVDGYLRGFDNQMADLDSIGDELLDKPGDTGGVSLEFGLRW